ncbi:MAG: hypothetical protein DYG99_16830 [Bacteroidetes bacterium CHB5]|nr:hypothetical protein [Bacteroidetes bacterium CHB5]
MNILNQALRQVNFNQNLGAMSLTISVLFYARKSRATTQGLIPIYMRVTLKGERFGVTTKVYVREEQWSIEAGKMKGSTEEAKRINSLLDAMRVRAFDYQREILNEGKPLNMDTFKHKWLGIVTERPRMLLEIFEHHNKQMKELIGQEFSPLTFERYTTSKKHTHVMISLLLK